MDLEGTLWQVVMLGGGFGNLNSASNGKKIKEPCNSSVMHVNDTHQGRRSMVPAAPIHVVGDWCATPALNDPGPDTHQRRSMAPTAPIHVVGGWSAMPALNDPGSLVPHQESTSNWNGDLGILAPASNHSKGNQGVVPQLNAPGPQVLDQEIISIWHMRNRIWTNIKQILCGNRNPNQWEDPVKLRNLRIWCDKVEEMLFEKALNKAEYEDCATLTSRVILAITSIKSRIRYSKGFNDQVIQAKKGSMEVITQSTPPLREPHTYCCSTGQPTCIQEYPNQQFSVQGVPPKNNSGPVAADRPEWLISSVNMSSNSSLNCDDYRQFQNNQPQHAKQNCIHSQVLSKVSCNGNAVNSRDSVDESAIASKPRKTTNRTRKVGGQTGDISPALEVPLKRRKISRTSTFPLPINITDHQLSEEMRPQQCPRMSYESSVTEEDEHCDSALSRELVGSNKPEPEPNSIIHEGRPVEENMSVNLNTEDFCSKYKITEPDIHTEIPITGDDRRGASLTEMFTKDQLEVHLASLKEWRGETKQKVDWKRAMADFENDSACQLCGIERLLFAIRCSWCDILFKKMDTYHIASKSGVGCRCCNKCFQKLGGEKTSVPGLQLYKAKISLDTEPSYQEPFVQCDTCERWQHYACALFNNERNFKGEAAYICPKCYIQDFKDGRRVPLAQGVIRGATDLPRTELSDHIEARLSARLKQEQDDRAKLMGMKPDEIPGAENLVVRVVLSVDKSLLVKQELLDVFKEENYPKKLPYRSKVILLFQKIDGVDVCLFGMYVQEYGSKGAHPNQRCIYISYLDSVRYFKPDDVIAATGEPLRTFVYHEILVGYLDYCKKRGFSRCYVWSCPPAKGDLYIFNCRPEIQGSPKLNILRNWYETVFRKAITENIVARVTNYHDYHFKSPDREHKVKAACLPCFDGDYLPLTAEAVLKKVVVKPQSVRKTRKKKPFFEADGCTDASGDPPLGDWLIKEFGKELKKQKENFIIVDLGTQHMAENTDQEEDEVIEGKIFDGREIFLAFCRENDYQFDNLQRAKHATMMFLYHLHNPSAFDEKKEEKKPNPDTGQEVGPQGK